MSQAAPRRPTRSRRQLIACPRLLILAITANTHDVTAPHPAPRATLSRRERATSPSPSGRGVGVRETLLGKYASLNNSILPFDCVYPGIRLTAVGRGVVERCAGMM